MVLLDSLRVVGHRHIDGDHIADMAGARIVEEALGARLPQRIVGMGDGRTGGNGRHDLGAGGIAHRRQLGRCTDIFDAGPRAEQAAKRAAQQRGSEILERDLRMANSYFRAVSWLGAAGIGPGGMAGPVARTVPAPVTTALTMR